MLTELASIGEDGVVFAENPSHESTSFLCINSIAGGWRGSPFPDTYNAKCSAGGRPTEFSTTAPNQYALDAHGPNTAAAHATASAGGTFMAVLNSL